MDESFLVTIFTNSNIIAKKVLTSRFKHRGIASFLIDQPCTLPFFQSTTNNMSYYHSLVNNSQVPQGHGFRSSVPPPPPPPQASTQGVIQELHALVVGSFGDSVTPRPPPPPSMPPMDPRLPQRVASLEKELEVAKRQAAGANCRKIHLAKKLAKANEAFENLMANMRSEDQKHQRTCDQYKRMREVSRVESDKLSSALSAEQNKVKRLRYALVQREQELASEKAKCQQAAKDHTAEVVRLLNALTKVEGTDGEHTRSVLKDREQQLAPAKVTFFKRAPEPAHLVVREAVSPQAKRQRVVSVDPDMTEEEEEEDDDEMLDVPLCRLVRGTAVVAQASVAEEEPPTATLYDMRSVMPEGYFEALSSNMQSVLSELMPGRELKLSPKIREVMGDKVKLDCVIVHHAWASRGASVSMRVRGRARALRLSEIESFLDVTPMADDTDLKPFMVGGDCEGHKVTAIKFYEDRAEVMSYEKVIQVIQV